MTNAMACNVDEKVPGKQIPRSRVSKEKGKLVLAACVALVCLQVAAKISGCLQTFFGRIRLGTAQASINCGWCNGARK